MISIPRSEAGKFRRSISKGKYKQVAAILAERLRTQLSERDSCDLPSFFLSGFSRSGKSLVARSLARYGIRSVGLDTVRKTYYDHEQRKYNIAPNTELCRKIIYSSFLKMAPTGIVLEGTDIWIHLRRKPDSRLQRAPFQGREVIFVGIDPGDVERKSEQLYLSAQAGHCNAAHSRQWCHKRAQEIADASAAMKSVAETSDHVHFLPVHPEIDMPGEAARTAAEIVDILRRPTAWDPS